MLIDDNFKLQYEPATVHFNKEIYISFYAFNPKTQRKERKVRRFNHLKDKMKKRDLEKFLNQVAAEITQKLKQGINPFIESDTPKGYEQLTDAIDRFYKIKGRDLRPDSLRSYNSFCNNLKTWIIENGYAKIFVVSFTHDTALELMNDLAENKKLGNRTWNNYLIFYRTLWNWLIENNYCKENPFEKFKKKRIDEKIRRVIPQEIHNNIVKYCRENMPEMEIVIDLIRIAFLRPKEISMIKLQDLDLNNQVVYVPSSNAKTHNARFGYLPDWLCMKIATVIPLEKHAPDDFLIASGLKPGKKHIGTRKLDKYWDKIRDDVGIGKEYQLYSYRDTGINYLEEQSVPRKVIQQLTGHKSIGMLENYIHKPSRELIDKIVSVIPEGSEV